MEKPYLLTFPQSLIRLERKGIYFLFKKDELVYIGQSVNVIARIMNHVTAKNTNRYNTPVTWEDFDSASFIELEDLQKKERLIVEAIFIRHYLPKLNNPRNANRYSTTEGEEEYLRSVNVKYPF